MLKLEFSEDVINRISELIHQGLIHSVPMNNKHVEEQWENVFSKLNIQVKKDGEYFYLTEQDVYAHPTTVRYSRPWEYLEKANQTQCIVVNLRPNGVFDMIVQDDSFGEKTAIRLSPEESAIGRCRKCSKYFFYSLLGSYKCPLCGEYDGDHHIEKTYLGSSSLVEEGLWDNLGWSYDDDENQKPSLLQRFKVADIATTLKVPTADEEWYGLDDAVKQYYPEEVLDLNSEWYTPAPRDFVAEYIYRYGEAFDLAKEEFWKLVAQKDTRAFCVYRHVSPSGKSYIGITSQDPEDRWGNGYNYMGQGFWTAILKYGWDSFEHYVYTETGFVKWPLPEGKTVKLFELDEARRLERSLIMKYNSYYDGYNESLGGEIPSVLRKMIEHSDISFIGKRNIKTNNQEEND